MTVTPPKVSAAVGEITPYVWWRTDLQWHASACRVMRNFIPLPWGPALFRPGWRFVAAAKNTNKEARLVPFRFGYTDGQAYILEIGDLYFRVFAEQGVVGAPTEVVTIYTESDLPNLRWSQSADVLYLVDGAHAPQQISRSSHTSWSIAAAAIVDGPYMAENTVAANTITPGATSGSPTFTAVNDTFASTDVGRHLRFKDANGNWFWIKITAYTNAKVVTGTIYKAGTTDAGTLASAAARATWRLGLYSDTTGWPYAICAHQGRLILCGQPSGSLPRIGASNSGQPLNFAPTTEDYTAHTSTVADDNAIDLAVASGDINVIFEAESLRELITLTAGKEFKTAAGVAGETLTPTTSETRPTTAHGAARVKPAQAYNAVLFVQRDGRTVRELAYAIEADGYKARSLMWRAEHMLRRGAPADANTVRQLAFQQEPWSSLWVCDELGSFFSLIYAPEQDLYGWAPHDAGASAADLAAGRGALCRSLAVIPYAGYDQLWAVFKRTVNGATLYSVEFMEVRLDWDDRVENAFHLDCGLTLDNTGENESGSGSCTLTPGSGATTKGQTGVTFTAGAAVFASGDVGRFILYHYKAPPGDYRGRDATDDTRLKGKVILRGGIDLETGFVLWLSALAEVTAYTDSTHVTCTVWDAFPSLAAIAAADWRFSVTTISGLDHLEGETVQVVGDGAPQTEKTVASGAITLDSPACTVHAGLGYDGFVVPLVTDAGSRMGTALGKIQRQHRIDIALLKSMGGKVFALGSEATEQIPYRRAQDRMDLRLQPFTGFKEVPLGGSAVRDPKFAIQQDVPLPFCLAAVVPHQNVGEAR